MIASIQLLPLDGRHPTGRIRKQWLQNASSIDIQRKEEALLTYNSKVKIRIIIKEM